MDEPPTVEIAGVPTVVGWHPEVAGPIFRVPLTAAPDDLWMVAYEIEWKKQVVPTSPRVGFAAGVPNATLVVKDRHELVIKAFDWLALFLTQVEYRTKYIRTQNDKNGAYAAEWYEAYRQTI